MLVKCTVCGSHVPVEASVEIPVQGKALHYCSLRCLEAEGSDAAREAPLPPLPEMPRRLLVAVDGSGPSLRATELAVTLAKSSGGRVILLNAVDPILMRLFPIEASLSGAARLGLPVEDFEKGLCADAEGQLRRCRQICEQAGVPVEVRIEVKQPLAAVAGAAEDADMVVIGSRGLGAFSGAALGSLSHRIIGGTRKPVLVVH